MTTMRPIRTIATALLVAGLAVAGCGRGQPDQTATPADGSPAVTAPPATTAPAVTGGPTRTRPEVLRDGRHPVLLTTIDPDRRTITFDLIQFYWGEEAAREAAKDHQESPPPNDYYSRNVNPRLRTLPVRADATITVITLAWGEDGGSGLDGVPVSLDKLATLKRSHSQGPPFWITVRNDQVTRIAEQFVP
jgi:hypothetical protein